MSSVPMYTSLNACGIGGGITSLMPMICSSMCQSVTPKIQMGAAIQGMLYLY